MQEDYRNNPDPKTGASKLQVTDIFARNLVTGKVLQLTSGPGIKLPPPVDSGRVFYIMLGSKTP